MIHRRLAVEPIAPDCGGDEGVRVDSEYDTTLSMKRR